MDDERSKSERAKREEETLKYWKDNGIFEKTLKKEAPKGEFVFYEGPPTANARPGIHHLIARAFKDVIPRYKTMCGFHVRRKAGWDTHGLPVELAVEKELGLTSKKQIDEYGVAAFNEKCKVDVWKYINEWQDFTERMGFWVDFDDAYITYYPSYIESLWNIIAHTNKRGLLYKDYKVVPWCPRCGTGLSSHELAQGYEDVKDISVYVKFKVVGEENTYLLAWTTTPWTLPGNVALAVGEDIEYVKISQNDEFLWLAKSRLSVIEGEYQIVEEAKGDKLVGILYEPLFSYMGDLISGSEKEKMGNAYKVYQANFVTTEDGTGIVHTAVMYGIDDFELGNEIGLPKFHLVNEEGKFIEKMDKYSGRFVRDEDVAVDVMKDLAEKNLLLKKEKYEHSYPNCWRCHTPLIYYARDSWYIGMSQLRDDLVAENAHINWVPGHIKEGRFGEWLREIKDWAISRDRYWGTPLPVWKCEACEHTEVIGSIEELKSKIKTRGNTFTFVRHGQAENNILDVASTKPDTPHHLTEKGKKDIEKVGKSLPKVKIKKIYTSPFIRTRETAEILAKELGLTDKDIVVDDRLYELRYGDLAERPHSDFYKYLDEKVKKFSDKLPNGESSQDVKRRLADFIYDLDSKNENEHIIAVTHGIAFETIPSILKGADDNEAQKIRMETETHPGDVLTFDFVPLPKNKDFDIDLHKPYIDEVDVKCSKCEKTMTRTPEVMDVWFDSGAMPFAQDHYPFEGKKGWFGKKKQDLAYPADYISEAIDQTRGWFYTLHAIGTLMGKGRAYNNVICLGHILDANGKKMSKSLGNTVNPWDMMDKYGVDIIRFWMFSVNQPGDPKNFDEKTVDEVSKKVFNILSNVVSFYELYKDNSQFTIHDAQSSTHVLDKWILARFAELNTLVTEELEKYHLFEPTRAIRDFAQDLSTWYIRRSRDRFKGDDEDDKKKALATTQFILRELAVLMAPFTPFFAEEMYKASGGEKESVHLEGWTNSQITIHNSQNNEILSDMTRVRDIVSKALESRMSSGFKVRQPLQKITLRGKGKKLEAKEDLLSLIKDEVNVKEILFSDDDEADVELDTTMTPELEKEGELRELIRSIQDFRKKSGLTPQDTPHISITTDEKGKQLIEEFKDTIVKSANLSDVSVSVGNTEEQFSFELKN